MSLSSPLRLQLEGRCLHLTLSDPSRGNLLNRALIDSLHAALDQVEATPELSLLTISAEGQTFCDGMDFSEALGNSGEAAAEIRLAVLRFHALLEHLARLPVVVVAMVEGRVNAGGMGLAAACDLVYALPKADFGLSEILFGLLPATVNPFLVRRTGLQATYRMALTGQRMDAERARACGLVDELISDPADAIRRLRLRTDRLDRRAVARTKAFYADWAGFNEAAGLKAADALASLLCDSQTLSNIQSFTLGTPAWLTRSS